MNNLDGIIARSTLSPEALAARWNRTFPVGTVVRYWTGVREGIGKVSTTRTEAEVLSGHTAVVWLNNESGCLALSHIEPIAGDGKIAAALVSPHLHLVQRYESPRAATGKKSGHHPGFCKVGECCGVAVALYSDHEGKGLEVCGKHEAELIANGRTKLGAAVSA
jgi:hypothetical protein